MQELETLESVVSNPHDTERLALPAPAKDPAGLPTLNRWQIVVPHEIRDEAFEGSATVDLSLFVVRFHVIACCDAVAVEPNEHQRRLPARLAAVNRPYRQLCATRMR